MNDLLDGPVGLLLQFAVLWLLLKFTDRIIDTVHWYIDRWTKKREPPKKPEAPRSHHKGGFDHPV